MSKSSDKPKKQQKQKPQKTLKERRSEKRAAKKFGSGSFAPGRQLDPRRSTALPGSMLPAGACGSRGSECVEPSKDPDVLRKPPPGPCGVPRGLSRRLGLHARSLALDPRHTCRRSEDARAPVVPADAKARRILGQNLLDNARPTRLSGLLRLDDDSVFHARVHVRPPAIRSRQPKASAGRPALVISRAPGFVPACRGLGARNP